MNSYEQRQEAKRARLEERAERLRKAGEGRINRAREMASAIPFGQPILVGHHSEKRDRNFRGKIRSNFDKGFETLKAAGEAAARAAAVGTGGVSSDDPDAIDKLTEQLNERKADQEKMASANKLVRKKDVAGLVKLGYPEKLAQKWVTVPIWGSKFCAFEPYQLSNNSANIRRIEQRIAELQRMSERETKETTQENGVRIVENVEDNRIQLFFPDKPPQAVRSILKQNGFRWSPTAGAWQRHLNNAGRYAAQHVLTKL